MSGLFANLPHNPGTILDTTGASTGNHSVQDEWAHPIEVLPLLSSLSEDERNRIACSVARRLLNGGAQNLMSSQEPRDGVDQNNDDYGNQGAEMRRD
ncbi:hypothetical protein BH10PAT3_BH10PAT3_4760 [soil metagenome]